MTGIEAKPAARGTKRETVAHGSFSTDSAGVVGRLMSAVRGNFFLTWPKDSGVSFVSIGECPENLLSGAPAYGWNYHGDDKAHAIAVLDGTGRGTG